MRSINVFLTLFDLPVFADKSTHWSTKIAVCWINVLINYGQLTPMTPTRLNWTQLRCIVRLANNAWSVHSSVTSQC